MGYYTNYSLAIVIEEDEGKYTKKDIIKHLRREYEEAMRALDEEGNSLNEAKWYKSDDDMLEFSIRYPNILLVLSGQGQDDEDKWKCYFKNGKSKKIFAKVAFSRFTPEKLVDSSMFEMSVDIKGSTYYLEFFEDDDQIDDEISFGLIEDMCKFYEGAKYISHEEEKFNNQEWPDYQANLVDFSQKYPEISFIVNNEPSWRKCFQNGYLQISGEYWAFEDFNEEMLQ